MPFHIIQSDITTLSVDAIVNPTDQRYSGGGGVDKRIHELCGPGLREATDKLARLHLGEAKATEGFTLPCKYIIHTSGPRWTGKSSLESMVLGSCYRNSVALASSLGCKSIAFPLIASKGKRFPKEAALTVAVNAIEESLTEYPDMEITLVIFGDFDSAILEGLGTYIQDSYIPDFSNCCEQIMGNVCAEDIAPRARRLELEPLDENFIRDLIEKPTQANLDKIPIDETFASMLGRILEERKLPHSAVQDEIAMSGPGFWKLLNGKSNPSKMTVFGIAIALKLSLEDTKEMLMKAGYAINQSSLQDVILSGLIQNKVYDRNTIDNLLYALDLQLLPGSVID